jgi:hypothetical protein
MALSARQLASRLGIDQFAPAQATYRAAELARYFARGYRYGQAAHDGPDAPTATPGERSALEKYAQSHSEGPGLYKWRHYFDIYDRHLSRFRGQPVRLIEIGVAGGGSLGMWRDYLGADALICGIDIDPECERFAEHGVEVIIGDQGDPAFWSTFLQDRGTFDVVIDDGSHLPEHQVLTLEKLLPRLARGGVYICEDIVGPLQPFHAFVDGLTRPLSSAGVGEEAYPANSLQREIASVHRYPLITVIEKTARAVDRFEAIRYGSEWPGRWSGVARSSNGPMT